MLRKPVDLVRAFLGPDDGVTILEIMIVLVILSLIAVVGTIQVAQLMDRAKVDVAKLQLRQISNSLEIFKIDAGRYPSADEGLSVLLADTEDIPGWRGPYLKGRDLLTDPWGSPVSYLPAGADNFQVVSLGSDRQAGGEGTAADISPERAP